MILTNHANPSLTYVVNLGKWLMLSVSFTIAMIICVINGWNIYSSNHTLNTNKLGTWRCLSCWLVSGVLWIISRQSKIYLWCLTRQIRCIHPLFCLYLLVKLLINFTAIGIIFVDAAESTVNIDCEGSNCSSVIYWTIISLSFMEVIYFVVDYVIFDKIPESDWLDVLEYFYPNDRRMDPQQTALKCKNVQYINIPNTTCTQ
eukprot:UN04871